MPVIESDCIILKSYGLSEADRIVVFFTRDHGLVRGVAKGAKRLKSKFGSSIEPFSESSVSYFQKDAVELVSIQSADLRRASFDIASRPEFLQRFAYLSELLIIFSQPHDPNETLYRMVRSCIETASQPSVSLAAIGVYFEAWLLRLSGFMPDWKSCGNCNRSLEAGTQLGYISDMHLVCSNCLHLPNAREFSPAAFDAYLATQKTTPADFAAKFTSDPPELRELSSIFKRIIERSIGRPVPLEMSLEVGAFTG